ncbi:MAG: type II toxin-antitoxin system RelE/ParE family toxin [Ignavibacteria bacterium]
MKGDDNLWRIRIGNYRVIYTIYDKEKLVDVSVIRHRKDAYR